MSSGSQLAKTILKDRQLKATPIRIQFISMLHTYQSAMPYSAIQAQLQSSDRTTLYRTMQTLLENGIIHKAHVGNDDTYYALCDHNCSVHAHYHDHVHFECTVCKNIRCEHLNDQVSIVLPTHQIDKINIHLKGVCHNCMN